MPGLPDLKTMSVSSGPTVRSTARMRKSRSLPPAASNSGRGYQTVSMSVTTLAAIAAQIVRCRPAACQRENAFFVMRVLRRSALFLAGDDLGERREILLGV